MADQLAFTPERVFTAGALPGAGYRVQFFQSGTTTPVTVFTTADLSVSHPSPLICDAAGVFPAVFSSGGAVKAVITQPDGASFYTLDPVFRVSTSASGASDVSFTPTVALPFDNVQEAIGGAAATAASGFTPFGLGVTGTNALVANIDATGIASGTYRFDATTTGTFPTGVTAANTGIFRVERENAGDAVEWLQSGAADRVFYRRMASSVKGAWREVLTSNQALAQGDIFYRGATNVERLPPGTALQLMRMNATGTAPEWSTPLPVRAWVNFDGATAAIRGSFNVTSVVRNGAGDYTINFTATMPDANYAAMVTAGGVGTLSIGNAAVGWAAIYATGSVRIGVSDNNSDANIDVGNINVVILR